MFRERSGRSVVEFADLVGMGLPAYRDIETYDDELLMVPSVAEVVRIAEALGVPTRILFAPDADSSRLHRITYSQLVARVRDFGDLAQLEDAVGWDLSDFLSSEEQALTHYPVEFLKELCDHLGLEWSAALP